MLDDTMKESFTKKTWTVIGAHDDPARYGYRIFHVLRDRGFEVYPVHPRLKEIDGVAVSKSVADLAVRPDVAVMVVNPVIGRRVMESINTAGIPIVWMQPGTRSAEIREYAQERGIRLIEDCVLVRMEQRED